MELDNIASVDGKNTILPQKILDEFNILRNDFNLGFFKGKTFNHIILLVSENKYNLYNNLSLNNIININNMLIIYINKNIDILNQNQILYNKLYDIYLYLLNLNNNLFIELINNINIHLNTLLIYDDFTNLNQFFNICIKNKLFLIAQY